MMPRNEQSPDLQDFEGDLVVVVNLLVGDHGTVGVQLRRQHGVCNTQTYRLNLKAAILV